MSAELLEKLLAKAEANLQEAAIGPFHPPMRKLTAVRKALDFPAETLTSSKIWELVLAALADKLSFDEIKQLTTEAHKRASVENLPE